MFKRVNSDVVPFSINSPAGNRYTFGTTDVSNDIDVNYNENIKKGFGTGPNEFPELEDFNALMYTGSYLASYLYQAGIPEWNDKQKYYINSIAMGSDGNIYRSLVGTEEIPNVNNNPTLAGSVSWKSILSDDVVKLTGNQTVAGVKTFSSNIVGNITGNSATATKLATAITIGGVSFDGSANINLPGVNTAGNQNTTGNAATVTNGVYTTGNQTIAGVKTFSSSPIVPAPTSDTQVANKAYVDSASGGAWSANDTRAKTALNASGVALIYACRAWVNFDGTGTVAIRASGNVSSVVDDNVGMYTVNFITYMVDNNYVVSTSSRQDRDSNEHAYSLLVRKGGAYLLNGLSVAHGHFASGQFYSDCSYGLVAVFR